MPMTSETTVTTDAESASSFRTGEVLLISLCHFVHDVYSSFLSPLLPLLIEKLSLSLTRAGLLSTVMQLPALINPFIGVWADRISVRWFIILAPSLTAVPMSLLGLAPNYSVLLILLFFVGISTSLFHVPAPVMVAKLSGPYKGRGMSFFMVGGEFARTLGPMAAVAAVALMGLEGFYPIMLFGLASSVWLYIKFKDVPIHIENQAPVSLKDTAKEISGVMLPLAGILFARGLMHASIVTFLPTYITQQSGELWLAGISLALVEGAGVIGVMTAGPLSDFFGRRKVLLVCLISAPILLLVFIQFDNWLRFPALILTGFTLLSTTPVMLAMVQEHSISSPAAANGILMMISFTARSVVVIVVGIIADRIGLQNTYLLSAALGFLGIPFIFMLPERVKQ
ncbi:MAG: MFS transporter [Desulfobacteraceae bacterium]|jgi:FSR family fosmidomycin resistance protein-like MFS transporter